jgi:putative two-component system response regulator
VNKIFQGSQFEPATPDGEMPKKRLQRILVVDDEEPNRDLLKQMIGVFGHEAELAKDGFEALAKLHMNIDLVLLDVVMPGMEGFEVARRIRSTSQTRDIPIIMVTARSGKEDRLRAVEAGANDFIAKPFDMTELKVRTASLLKMKEHQDAIKRYQLELEDTVQRRTADLRRALEEMSAAQKRTHEAYLDTIYRLALVAEYKDQYTGCHIARMSHICAILAGGLKLPPEEVEIIRAASPMHDVGKIGIPDAILLKPGSLTPEEWEVMKQHTSIGARILSGSNSEVLHAGEIIALSHHEKWDGSGYPHGWVGEEIPLWGRICAVADVYDAITSERPYKKALSHERALQIMVEERGRHFDPKLLDLFLDNLEEIIRSACSIR